MTVFGTDYAAIYDSLYAERNIKADVRAVKQIINDYYGQKDRRTLLDMGCGTGLHAAGFQKDYEVTGMDLSEPMLEIARKRLPKANFFHGDIENLRILEGHPFDVVTMMFGVLSYKCKNEEVLETLKNVRWHLKAGGLFVFDVWYGPTVLLNKPTERIKKFEKDGMHVIRHVRPDLDERTNRCFCRYQWWVVQEGKPVDSKEETHIMRYFFPMELRLFFELSGFKLLRMGSPGHAYRDVEPNAWHAMFICQAC